jgi:hypothetical protein
MSAVQAKASFDAANGNLRKVSMALTGAGASAGEHEIRTAGALLDAANKALDLWRGVAGGAKASGKAAELRSLVFQLGRQLPNNPEGTAMESHGLGAAATLDGLAALLEDTAHKPVPVLRMAATTLHQSALGRYRRAMAAPDTRVIAIASQANHSNRVEMFRLLHRGVVDIAAGAEALYN